MDVLLLFKTHLDIGYTDYAKKVIDNYINEFIPNAIKVGYELKDTDTPFIWITGSWLINEALKFDKDKSLERAINDGIIAWHGLPFTTHTELMTEEMFEYGISICEKLDARFGKKTIGAKMTDVPGHTMGMVPLCSKHGIEFIHIGVNPATPVPEVPALFKWKCGDAELTVMYEKDYGEVANFGDFIVYFAHTGDNHGPQSGEEIKKIYDEISEQYPGADIKISTLDDVAKRVRSIKDLPVVDKEIGDTWIHGLATDPKKLSKYRTLQRYVSKNGIDKDLSDNLLMVPEHTWGMNIQKNFTDLDVWHEDEVFKPELKDMKKRVEGTWTEQREYVEKAEALLGIKAEYDTSEPYLNGFTEIDDELNELELSWQIFDNSDYERFKEVYLKLTPKTRGWAISDFTKLGLPEYKGEIYIAKVKSAYQKDDKKIYRLEFDEEVSKEYGLPYLWVEQNGNEYTIKWKNKRAERIPQAFWAKFKGLNEAWEINKMGQWISPENIIGSPLITGFDKGIRNADVEIISPDAALAAPFGRRLLDFELNPKNQDIYFNLYNNIWNTNFPMWYSDDAVFKFIISKR